MRRRQGAIEVLAPVVDDILHLSVLLTAFVPYKVRCVDSTSHDTEWEVAPRDHRISLGNAEGMCALGHTGCTKAAIEGEVLQLTSKEQQKRELLNQQFGHMRSNNEFPAGRSSDGRPMHYIELVAGAAPSLVPRYRRPPNWRRKLRGRGMSC